MNETEPSKSKETKNQEPKPTKKRARRPTSYDPIIATKIISGMAEGKSVSTICKKKDMPASSTFFQWCSDDKRDNRYNGLAGRYAQAMGERAINEFEGIVELENELLDREAGRFKTKEDIMACRVVLDSRRWRLAKMAPSAFGDRLAVDAKVEHTSAPDPVGSAPAHIRKRLEDRRPPPEIIDVTPVEVDAPPKSVVPPVGKVD